MNQETRSTDVKLHSIQKGLLKGIIPIISVIDKFLGHDFQVTDKNKLLKDLLDGVALLASTNVNLSLYRKSNIKNNMKPAYKKLCTSQTNITSFLFGDDVVDKMKAISDDIKMAQKVSS